MACPNSVVASGVTINATEVRLGCCDPSACTPVGPGGGAKCAGSDSGAVVNIVPDAGISGFHIQPVANGTSTLTFSLPGYQPVNVLVTVAMPVLDVVKLP